MADDGSCQPAPSPPAGLRRNQSGRAPAARFLSSPLARGREGGERGRNGKWWWASTGRNGEAMVGVLYSAPPLYTHPLRTPVAGGPSPAAPPTAVGPTSSRARALCSRAPVELGPPPFKEPAPVRTRVRSSLREGWPLGGEVRAHASVDWW